MNNAYTAKNVLLGLVVVFLTVLSPPSFADTFQRVGVLKCDAQNNSFIVRFGVLFNDDTLEKVELSDTTADVLQDWQLMTIAPQSRCKLADGQTISLALKNGQAFAHGAGGGDPDAAFTLKINEKTIYFRKPFYDGYGAGRYALHSLTYKQHTLSECSTHSAETKECLARGSRRMFCVTQDKKAKNVTCTNASARLQGNTLSKEEVSEQEKEEKRIKFKNNLSPFCKDVRRHLRIHRNGNAAYKYLGKTPSGHLSALDIDINNDGKIDKVFRIGGGSSDCISCGNHSFDGSYLVLFTKNPEAAAPFLDLIKSPEYTINTETDIHDNPQSEAHFISLGLAGSSVNYVYNMPFSYKDRNYIYTFETNVEKIPSASISEMTPSDQIKTVCTFP